MWTSGRTTTRQLTRRNGAQLREKVIQWNRRPWSAIVVAKPLLDNRFILRRQHIERQRLLGNAHPLLWTEARQFLKNLTDACALKWYYPALGRQARQNQS